MQELVKSWAVISRAGDETKSLGGIGHMLRTRTRWIHSQEGHRVEPTGEAQERQTTAHLKAVHLVGKQSALLKIWSLTWYIWLKLSRNGRFWSPCLPSLSPNLKLHAQSLHSELYDVSIIFQRWPSMHNRQCKARPKGLSHPTGVQGHAPPPSPHLDKKIGHCSLPIMWLHAFWGIST